MAAIADGPSTWQWSPAHQNYYVVVYRFDGSYYYEWSRSVQPTQAISSTTPTTERPHYDLNNSGRKYPPGSYFNHYPPGPPHLLRCPLHRQPGHDHLSCNLHYPCYSPRNPYFIEQCRLFISYGQLNHPTTTMTHCDYPYCIDPYCVERQLRTKGFRDDLKHHEDDDKNGNMKDGDNVGEHQRCGRTDGSSSDSDSSDAYRRY